MKIKIDRTENFQEVRKVSVMINDVEYVISVNQFDQLVINKSSIESDSTIIVKPSQSNEIRIE